MQEKLQSKYASIAERIILMALESVDYSEDKAIQILNIVVADTQKEDKAAEANESNELKSSQDEAMQLDLKG